jgi:aryl-alcohol dehydrogenase-like predicted oxidoreductase
VVFLFFTLSVFMISIYAGINFFDNAETYGKPPGEAERIMGEAIRQLQEEDPALWRRSDIVVTTKLFWGGPGVNERGLSRKHIKEGMAASLKNLQMDYVDVVFCHRPDPSTPTEQVVRNMTELVRSGQAHAWGTSEWSAQQITEAVWMARAYGLEPPCVEQPQYNMFHRERFETEYAPLYQHPYNIGTTIWSPLASGLLTGKYNDSVPEENILALGVARRMTTEQYQEVNKILGNTPDFYKGYGSIALAKQIGRHAERI